MITSESLRRDIARIIVWFPLRWIIIYFPWAKKEFFFFRLMGNFHYYLSKGLKKLLSENFNRAFNKSQPPKPFDNEIKRHLQNHYVSNMLIIMTPKFNSKNIHSYHSFENFEIIEENLKKGKGCILIHPHFGAVQLPFFHLAFTGYNIVQIGELIKPPNLSKIGEKVFQIRQDYEDSLPQKIISPRNFLRPVFQHLQNNGLVMMTGDGTGGGRFYGKFVTVDFLNNKMKFPIGAASLAEKTGSSLIPIFTVADKNGRYKTIVDKPINFIECEDKNKQIEETVKQFASVFEKYVKQYPEMWLLWDEFVPGLILEKE